MSQVLQSQFLNIYQHTTIIIGIEKEAISFLPIRKSHSQDPYKAQINKRKAQEVYLIIVLFDNSVLRMKIKRPTLNNQFLCRGFMKYDGLCRNVIGQKNLANGNITKGKTQPSLYRFSFAYTAFFPSRYGERSLLELGSYLHR